MHSRSATRRSRPVRLPRIRNRKGSAIILVVIATSGLAALALSAILMASSSRLMTQYYDRERDFRYAAEQALAQGLSQLSKDTTVHLADSGYIQLLSNAQLSDAYSNPLPRIRVNLYAGLTGSTTGQFGQYASLVAEARDSTGNTRYVRRLELQVQNFARYAMFTNTWPPVCYSTGEFIRGLGFSNQQWQSCGSPTYYDTISAVTSVFGGTPTYQKGFKNGVAPIPFPTVGKLAALPTYASNANYSLTPNVKGGMRIEFVPIRVLYSNPTDTTAYDANDGFFRVFQDTLTAIPPGGTGAGSVAMETGRAYYDNGVKDSVVYDQQCGDWHMDGGQLAFFPYWAHLQPWFGTRTGLSSSQITTDTTSSPPSGAGIGRRSVMSHTAPRQARCYPAGDPHLVAVERPSPTYTAAQINKGGLDTTFTPVTRSGYWMAWPGTVPAALTSAVPDINDREAPYLFPLYRLYNPGTKGVIYVNGDVALSGTLNGFVTLYASGNVWMTDDLYYTQDPASVLCKNLLGIIAGQNVWIADNAINAPQNPTNPASPTGPANSMFMSDNKDFFLDGVTLAGVALSNGTVGVENWGSHAINMTTCNGTPVGRGCIKQAGGVIEEQITATYNGSGSGFAENRSVDQCLMQMSPPYFPLTGKYASNRYYEVDPARYNIDSLYKRLQAGF